jgi:hypothetical protein
LLKTFCPNGEFPSAVSSQWDTALAPYKKIIMKQDEKIADLTRRLDELKTTKEQIADENDQQKCNGVSLNVNNYITNYFFSILKALIPLIMRLLLNHRLFKTLMK